MTPRAIPTMKQGVLFEEPLVPVDQVGLLDLDNTTSNQSSNIFFTLLYDGKNYITAEGDVLPIRRKKQVSPEPWPEDVNFLNH